MSNDTLETINTETAYNAGFKTGQTLAEVRGLVVVGLLCVGTYVTAKKVAGFVVETHKARKARKIDKKNGIIS